MCSLQDLAVTVNLIPWNPVLSPDMNFKAPGHDRVRSWGLLYPVFCVLLQLCVAREQPVNQRSP